MFLFARPFWKIKVRSTRHRAIMDAVVADPRRTSLVRSRSSMPTRLRILRPSFRGPNQHYPTLSWEAIENFRVYGKRIKDIAHENAMLFLWTTSSNIPFALKVMQSWGFEFKASAAWDKGVQGTV
jgi:hypothetical protein